ncbi:hypothetical protein SAMN03159423_0474 [Bradyrhizobium sp. NFR13]|uniref:hypothetical protein n=1 Tax=Bradyrhizobium sp. NFR13 TaxID=1566285 RepID=UPI0008EF162C|nr:hypothetical protein [Bradyrhizobium sp. NFR13]SFM29605.1 hypothetical protein SAMN03159423_0474 [Bradyrhizobium sp. NFR13]
MANSGLLAVFKSQRDFFSRGLTEMQAGRLKHIEKGVDVTDKSIAEYQDRLAHFEDLVAKHQET